MPGQPVDMTEPSPSGFRANCCLDSLEGQTSRSGSLSRSAGRSANPEARVTWEGQVYRVDMTSAEAHRLRTVRERQQSYTVDFALALHRVARWLAKMA